MIVRIYLLFVILGIFFKKSRPLSCFILVFMWIVGTFCYGNADDSVYINRYSHPELWVSYTEYGFNTIIYICKYIGLSYTEFKGVVFAIEIVLIGSTVLKYAKYPNLVLLLYFICPFPLNVTQIRSSLATSVMIFACRYLFEDSDKNKIHLNDLKFIICIFLASLIHTLSILWFVLILAKKWDLKKISIFTLLFNMAIYFVITPQFILKIVSLFGAGRRIGAYLTLEYARSSWRHRGPVIYVLFVALTILLMTTYFEKNKYIHRNLSDMEIQRLYLCKKINMLLLILVSIILRYTAEVTRVQEGIAIINYTLISNCINSKSFKLTQSNLVVLLSIIAFGLLYLWLIILYYLTDLVWIPFWFNNTFFERIQDMVSLM